MGRDNFIITIDAGGTMTDAFMIDRDGRFVIGKGLTNYEDESRSYLEATTDAAAYWEHDAVKVHQEAIVSAYTGTIMLNILLTRKGGKKVGMLVTKGMEDELYKERALTYLGQSMMEMYLQRLHVHTPPLLDYRHVRGVPERVVSGSYFFTTQPGTVLVPLNEERVREEVRYLLTEGVEVIGITFLYSYLNPIHEKRAKEIALEEIARALAEVEVICSHELIPVMKEGQRLKSVLIEGFAASAARKNLKRVEEAAKGQGYSHSLYTVTSYGSTVTVDHPRLYETIISGPVGGLIGSKAIGDLKGLENIVACDIGGTSFDVGFITAGRTVLKREPDFARHRLALLSLLELFVRNLLTFYVRQFCSLTLSEMVPGQDF